MRSSSVGSVAWVSVVSRAQRRPRPAVPHPHWPNGQALLLGSQLASYFYWSSRVTGSQSLEMRAQGGDPWGELGLLESETRCAGWSSP